MKAPTCITFFESLMPLITSGKKTITIRDKSESYYTPDSLVEVFTLETDKKVCDIKIVSVESLHFDEINHYHAEQEHLPLPKLKKLIRDIYPNNDDLFMIRFELTGSS
ncbi:N(4)-acetylcytidine aminohydrolase [Vibrio hepatarius]|uniref:N(4)-acetylcytidine aminohydrolase n=1 Tax=Vibrio hepatarius TaxID=171383 RepID=UPI001C0A3CD7|nr:N(4)-acetylcytidine aminohydrolase [Vibrio hepatarius]MBU2897493.1 N(4)-acetylcytidine aminohydrolase [Vibrio hepatarius]